MSHSKNPSLSKNPSSELLSNNVCSQAAEPKRPPYRNVSHPVKVVDGMNAMRIAGLLCDVTLVAENLEIPAHKMVLAACSPYFYAMFTGFTERDSSRVTLQGLDPEALQILVEYVYTSEVGG